MNDKPDHMSHCGRPIVFGRSIVFGGYRVRCGAPIPRDGCPAERADCPFSATYVPWPPPNPAHRIAIEEA